MTLAIDRLTVWVGETVSKCHRHGDLPEGRHEYGNARERGYAQSQKELSLGSGKYWMVNLQEHRLLELLAHDREKGRFDFNPNKHRPFKWKLERFSFNHESAHYSRTDSNTIFMSQTII